MWSGLFLLPGDSLSHIITWVESQNGVALHAVPDPVREMVLARQLRSSEKPIALRKRQLRVSQAERGQVNDP